MSKYLLNKFLFTVDRDPDLVERYRTDPVGTVQWWEAGEANRILNCISQEQSTWLRFEEAERAALAAHDYPKLFTGNPDCQKFPIAARLAHFAQPYPDIAT